MGIPSPLCSSTIIASARKLAELGEFIGRHNVKMAVIQESKLFSNPKNKSVQNFTTIRKDRCQALKRWFTHLDLQVDKLLSDD